VQLANRPLRVRLRNGFSRLGPQDFVSVMIHIGPTTGAFHLFSLHKAPIPQLQRYMLAAVSESS
jgi:hypothetical protein